MAIASTAMSAAGAASSTVGAYYSALGQKSSLKFQATLAEINAKAAESDARLSLDRGEKMEQKAALDTAALKSDQRVAYGSSGIDLGSDTAVQVLTSTDVLGEMDRNQIKANALREAWGHRTQAVNDRNSALMSRATADGISPMMNAATTFLTGAGQVAQQYYTAKESGALQTSKENWAKYGDKAKSFLSGLKGF
jgi:peptidoglycan hydrolase-like amidase